MQAWGRFGQSRVQPQGEGFTKLAQTEPGQGSQNGRVTRRFVPRRPKWVLEVVPVGFGPALDYGHLSYPSQQPEKDERSDARKWVPHPSSLTWIRNLREYLRQLRQRTRDHPAALHETSENPCRSSAATPLYALNRPRVCRNGLCHSPGGGLRRLVLPVNLRILTRLGRTSHSPRKPRIFAGGALRRSSSFSRRPGATFMGRPFVAQPGHPPNRAARATRGKCD